MMTLRLYRRHRASCLHSINTALKSGSLRLPPSTTRQQFLNDYSDCRCMIYIDGTNQYGDEIPRHSTRACNFEAAQREFLECNQDQKNKKPPSKPLEQAYEEWFNDEVKENTERTTQQNYENAFKNLKRFLLESRGLKQPTLEDVSVDLLYSLMAHWTAQKRKLGGIRGYMRVYNIFFKHAATRQWIPENPINRMTLHKQNSKKRRLAHFEQARCGATPLDEKGDANWRKLREAVAPFIAQRRFFKPVSIGHHPENFLALCELMYFTGLRISDAVQFQPHKIVHTPQGGDYTTAQQKTGFLVTCFLPRWLVKKLCALEPVAPGYPFWDGDEERMVRYINNEIRTPLKELGKRLGFSQYLRPHRFRDSFAVNELVAGRPIKQVSMLLGHQSVLLTEKYYDHWNPNRITALREDYYAHKASRGLELVAEEKAG